jgi:hypothetical protein
LEKCYFAVEREKLAVAVYTHKEVVVKAPSIQNVMQQPDNIPLKKKINKERSTSPPIEFGLKPAYETTLMKKIYHRIAEVMNFSATHANYAGPKGSLATISTKGKGAGMQKTLIAACRWCQKYGGQSDSLICWICENET